MTDDDEDHINQDASKTNPTSETNQDKPKSILLYSKSTNRLSSDDSDITKPISKQIKTVSFYEDTAVVSSPISETFELPSGGEQPKGLFTEDDRQALLNAYKNSCKLHDTQPIKAIVDQIAEVKLLDEDECENYRFGEFSLRALKLSPSDIEPIEEILSRMQFTQIDIECTEFTEPDAAVSLIEIITYYDSAEEVFIGFNSSNLTFRIWQALSRLVRSSPVLKVIDIRGSLQPEKAITTWCRAIRGSLNIRTLHLEQTRLAGRPFSLLCVALHWNRTVQELFLADNDLSAADMKSLSFALKNNRILGLLDLRNNNLQDAGVKELCFGLSQQYLQHTQKDESEKNAEKDLLNDADNIDKVSLSQTSSHCESEIQETGVHTLVLWNNSITSQSMQAVTNLIKSYEWLLTLNLGQNPKICDDGVFTLRTGLQRAKLQRLGMYNCGLECEAAVAIAEVIVEARHLFRIDLRKNLIRFSGIMALSLAYRHNMTL